MLRFDRTYRGLGLAALIFALGFGLGRAQTGAASAPRGEKTILENERVRVVAFALEPGVAMGMHGHPRDRVEINVVGGRVRVTTEDGKTEEAEEKTGEIVFNKASASRHDVVNIGTTTIRAYHVELK
jgi:quercetin dioxygenase-like cupin family protein